MLPLADEPRLPVDPPELADGLADELADEVADQLADGEADQLAEEEADQLEELAVLEAAVQAGADHVLDVAAAVVDGAKDQTKMVSISVTVTVVALCVYVPGVYVDATG